MRYEAHGRNSNAREGAGAGGNWELGTRQRVAKHAKAVANCLPTSPASAYKSNPEGCDYIPRLTGQVVR